MEATADLISGAPGEDVTLRAICDIAGVQLPTLYHFFGSKEGLLNTTVSDVFDRAIAAEGLRERTYAGTLGEIRDVWDAHVAFGLAQPGFYVLMFGRARPNYLTPAAETARSLLAAPIEAASAAGALTAPADEALAILLAAAVGVTLTLIVTGTTDTALADATVTALLRDVSSVAAH